MLTIMVVGKKHESWVADGIKRYQQRLSAPFNCQWVLLPHSRFDGPMARQDESRALLARLNTDDIVILLDERGQMLDSPSLASQLTDFLQRGRRIVLIIGGAYGVTDELRERAQLVWSLSALVFPHQLVRLVLTEQLYRAQQISLGGAYHHL